MANFWIRQGFPYTSITQRSKYTRICLDRFLNISRVLNMPGFWIWQRSKYASATFLNMAEYVWIGHEYVWIGFLNVSCPQTFRQKHKKRQRPRRETFWSFFLLDTIKTTFRMENLTQIWTQSEPFPPKSRHLSIFKKGQGRRPSSRLVVCLWLWVNSK